MAWVRAACEHGGMAYDKELAERIRACLPAEPDLTEKTMFGGLAFLIAGSMAVAASGTGGLMARVDPAETDALCAADGVAPMVMRGREMRGWLRVAPDVLDHSGALDEWVARCVAYVKGTVNHPGD